MRLAPPQTPHRAPVALRAPAALLVRALINTLVPVAVLVLVLVRFRCSLRFSVLGVSVSLWLYFAAAYIRR
jgi:hypothetical protein